MMKVNDILSIVGYQRDTPASSERFSMNYNEGLWSGITVLS